MQLFNSFTPLYNPALKAETYYNTSAASSDMKCKSETTCIPMPFSMRDVPAAPPG